jgi:uncharacterized protein (TIGR00299 family) protein
MVQFQGSDEAVKVLYFDCFAGAAGDMILGALLDAGLPLDALRSALGSLAVGGWTVSTERVRRAGVTATKFRVHEEKGPQEARAGGGAHEASGHHHHHPHSHDPHHEHPPHSARHDHRSLEAIGTAIDRSALSSAGKDRAKALFARLGEAEAAVHGIPIDRIHLHEVGAIDSIIDVVGAVFALEWFGAGRIVVSPINVGGGMVQSAHGLLPVPAPATVRLLGDAPVYSSGLQSELLTPTGALLLSDYASAYGPLPAMRVETVGYGAGDRDLAGTPNVLRVIVGQADERAAAMRVVVMESEIDDMNPQLFGPLMDHLYAAGALEVCYTPVQMKKGRPGTLVTIVARPDERAALADIVFRETTTIGMRYQEMDRECLDREIVPVPTPLGPVRFKVARRGEAILNAQPEFDDLARLADEHAMPIKEVQAAAWKAWLDR